MFKYLHKGSPRAERGAAVRTDHGEYGEKELESRLLQRGVLEGIGAVGRREPADNVAAHDDDGVQLLFQRADLERAAVRREAGQ